MRSHKPTYLPYQLIVLHYSSKIIFQAIEELHKHNLIHLNEFQKEISLIERGREKGGKGFEPKAA